MSDQIKSFCNNCVGERNHIVLFEEYEKGSEDVDEGKYSVEWGNKHRMIKCNGCDSISMRKDSWFSEDTDDYGRPNIGTSYFPPIIYKKQPPWLEHFGLFTGPDEIEDLLREIYICLQNACPRSAAMASRALLEHLFISVIGKDFGAFFNNMEEFQKLGKISEIQKQAITDVLEAGHASIHRGFKPKREDIITIVSIIENLIEVLYVHQNELTKLKARIPKRQASLPKQPE